MRIDEYGCIEMEQCKWPGSIGDSAAESGRYEHLNMLLGNYVHICNLENFVTATGYIRHPTAPDAGAVLPNGEVTKESWRESDFSSDQALPLYLAWRKGGNYVRTNQMERRFRRNFFRTGNGDLLTPGLFAEMYAPLLRVPLLLAQLAIFKFKYRWNDELNRFEENTESSCDYINFIHVAVYAPKWLRRRIDARNLYNKVRDYYNVEPNCVFLKSLYHQVIFKYFGPEAE